MQFCPKDGSILLPQKRGKKIKMKCPKCSYSTKKKEELILKEEVKIGKGIEVIDKKVETLPKIKAECPKCKNPDAYYWFLQTRSGDEAATQFFKCTKCNYTWRSYG